MSRSNDVSGLSFRIERDDALPGHLDTEGDIFNLTNEPNFNNPTGDMRSGSFLSVSSLGGGGISRWLQVGMRLGF